MRARSVGIPIVRPSPTAMLSCVRARWRSPLPLRASSIRPYSCGGVRQPRTRAEPRVEGEGRLEVLLRALPLPEDGRVHPEVAVGGAVAGDEVPDHRVRARVRQQLAIEGLRERLVAEHGARVGEVHERRDPQRRPQRADPVPDQPAELAARVVDHAELGEHGDEAGPPGAVARGAAEEADDRRDLREPTLLAPDAEHLDAVRARRVPRGEEPPHSCDRIAALSAETRLPSQSSSAER